MSRIEQIRRSYNRPSGRLGLAALALTSSLLAGCEAASDSPRPTSTTTGPTSTQSQTGVPRPSATAPSDRPVSSMKGHLDYSALPACIGGAEHPCVGLLRPTPAFQRTADNILNKLVYMERFKADAPFWPQEAMTGRAADEFTVVCRVQDQTDPTIPKSNVSEVWDAVIIPPSRSQTGRQEVGYINERWVKLPVHEYFAVGSCSPADNPAGAELVTTPIS